MAFKTVLAAHDAFYQALGNADVELMTRVWSPTETTVCIHPLWPPLIGQANIITSWTEMFHNSPTMTVETKVLSQQNCQDSCIQLVSEILSAPGRSKPSPVLATNAYELTDHGWLMVLHHASPTPIAESAEQDTYPLH